MLGATIVLPDHPQIAPESRGNLFDNTEIEEALLLHVQALSDAERAEIAQQDPAVREMIERAETATPEDMMRLHGRVTMRDPREGEHEVTVGGVTFRRGTEVVLRPDPERDPYDRMLHGRPATVERIYLDYDGDRVHLAVSIDDDPGARPDARERPLPLLQARRGGGAVSERTRQILVAGIGNAFMGDDGFGGQVAQRLEKRKLPDGVSVFDFGTGGLDLAYEVMRGYDALVIVDINRQGEAPGTVFVMEPDPADIDGGHRGRRGDRPARDGPADGAAIREDGGRLARQGRDRGLRADGGGGGGAGASRRRWRARSTRRSRWCSSRWRSSARTPPT